MAADERDLVLRPVREPDDALLDELFASTRGPELEGLPAEARGPFIALQRSAQERAWGRAFPGLDRWVVMVGGQPAGRLYVHHGTECTLVDITLLPSCRGAGVGTTLLTDLQREAAARGAPVVLSVDRDSPARRLYTRLGFAAEGGDEVRVAMRWTGTH